MYSIITLKLFHTYHMMKPTCFVKSHFVNANSPSLNLNKISVYMFYQTCLVGNISWSNTSKTHYFYYVKYIKNIINKIIQIILYVK